MTKQINLNIAQREASNALELFRKKGNKKGVVVLPTATGKTYLAIHDSLKFNGKVLFVVHNIEILEQTIIAFKKFYPHVDTYGLFTGNRKDIDKRILFATTQTLTKHLNRFENDEFDYIIVDEVHHYQARTYKRIIQHFNPKFLLGLTATPYRMDNKSIFDLCGEEVYRMRMNDAMRENLICPIDYYQVDHNIDFTKIKYHSYNYSERDLNKKYAATI